MSSFNSLPKLLILLLLSCSVAWAKEASCLYNYRFRFFQTLDTFLVRQFSAWGGGGGPQERIGEETGLKFAGRMYGGGDRHTIYGSRQYGSGYPGSVPDPTTIAGRDFPYGSYPIYWADNYLGGEEYSGDEVEGQRPGGQLVTVPVQTSDKGKWPDVADNEIYYMIGDRESVVSVMASMVDWCKANSRWPSAFDPSASSSLKPENVIQYYRASSFALAFTGYNNSFALSQLRTDLTHDQSDPLPDTLINSGFLKCVNETVSGTIPILDAPPKKQSPGITAAIILCSIFGLPALYLIIIGLWLLVKGIIGCFK